MKLKRLVSIGVLAAFALLMTVVPSFTQVTPPTAPGGNQKATLVRAGGFAQIGSAGQITIAPKAGQTTTVFQPIDYAGVAMSASAANYGRFGFDSTAQAFQISNNGSTVGRVVGSFKPVDLLTQAASITATNLWASAPAGMYQVAYYVEITRAATTSSSIKLTVGFTDDTGAESIDVAAAVTSNATGVAAAGSQTIYLPAAGNITYATAYVSVGATTMQYAVHLRVKAL
jgi:hypothetical protein